MEEIDISLPLKSTMVFDASEYIIGTDHLCLDFGDKTTLNFENINELVFRQENKKFVFVKAK